MLFMKELTLMTKDKPSQIVKIPEELSSIRNEIREKVLETLADFDDVLMEKILEDVPTSTEEIYKYLTKDIASNKIVEVLTGSAEKGNWYSSIIEKY